MYYYIVYIEFIFKTCKNIPKMADITSTSQLPKGFVWQVKISAPLIFPGVHNLTKRRGGFRKIIKNGDNFFANEPFVFKWIPFF